MSQRRRNKPVNKGKARKSTNPRTREHLYSHFSLRAEQRLGIKLTQRQYLKLTWLVKCDYLPLLYKESNTRRVYFAYINSKWVGLVYNKTNKGLATVLTEQQLESCIAAYGETLEQHKDAYLHESDWLDTHLDPVTLEKEQKERERYKRAAAREQEPEQELVPVAVTTPKPPKTSTGYSETASNHWHALVAPVLPPYIQNLI